MATYKGFTYEARPKGFWSVTTPDGGKVKAPPQTEDELKAEIDRMIAEAKP